eukprot:GHVT01082529.1.p1 GENE.GHVT01082529.1~~GHVT01082529.1.p1  ORF type:complete len:197 (+),score=48.33 GHVT01082529.1:1557-2147(+)
MIGRRAWPRRGRASFCASALPSTARAAPSALPPTSSPHAPWRCGGSTAAVTEKDPPVFAAVRRAHDRRLFSSAPSMQQQQQRQQQLQHPEHQLAKEMEAAALEGPISRSIRDKLTTTLAPSKLEIRNDSKEHTGHPAMKGNNRTETHFWVSICSEAFAGLRPLERHRLVYKILDDEIKKENGIHALSIQACSPNEA